MAFALPLRGVPKVEAMAAPEPLPAVQDGDTAVTGRAVKPGSMTSEVHRRRVESNPLLDLLTVDGVCQCDAVATAVDGDGAGDMATARPCDRA